MAIAMDSRAFRSMMHNIGVTTELPIIISDGIIVVGRLDTKPISMEDPEFEAWFDFGHPDVTKKPENVLAFYRYLE